MTDEARVEHRLEGLEPDNLLAFLALLGLLRALEEVRPSWRPRVRWSLDQPPHRPVLVLRQSEPAAAVAAVAAEGVAKLAQAHAFGGKADLNHTAGEARDALERGRDAGGYAAGLAAALFSDAAVKMAMGKPLDVVEPTPLCLMFGQGHQHFLDRFSSVPRQPAPPRRGRGKTLVQITDAQCLSEALFSAWTRPNSTFSFRWDPAEDVRYALMFGDPSNAANKDGTQHGANRLAAVGLTVLVAAPTQRGGAVRLALPGGATDHGFSFAWPVWRDALSLPAISGLLSHPQLRQPGALARLGVDHVREARRIPNGKFMNVTAARPVEMPDSDRP